MNALRQYSLRGLFFATLVVAISCWFVLYLSLQLWIVLMWMLGLSAVVSTVVYGQGNVRAFAIGCIPPVLWWGISGRSGLPTTGGNVEFLFACGLITALSGYMSVSVRRWLVRQIDDGSPVAAERTEQEAHNREAADEVRRASRWAEAEPADEDDVFQFIEDNRKYWKCPCCHDTFISLQLQPACPRCGNEFVYEQTSARRVREAVLAAGNRSLGP